MAARPWRRPGPLWRGVLRAVDALGHVQALRVSRTGHDNPRTRHVVGVLGFSWYSSKVARAIQEEWAAGVEVFPPVVQVQTVNRCQAACAFCPYPDTVAREPREVMADETWTRIARECASEPGLRSLVPMSQNEPLLDSRLAERIAEFTAIRQPHQWVEIVTNGAALTLDRLRRLGRAGLDIVTVSLNASDEETYDRVMRGLSWQRVTANLDAINEADVPDVNVYVRHTRSLANPRERRGLRRRWRTLNWFGFTINNRAGTVRGFERLRVRRAEWWRTIRRRAVDKTLAGCPYVFGIAHVQANGDVPFCDNDWAHRLVLGNVNDTSLRELFNSPTMNEVRRLQMERRFDEIDACRECSVREDLFR